MKSSFSSVFFRSLSAALLCALLTSSAMAQSQTWPAKVVKFVVPFAAGGTTDIVARILGQRLGELWGQTVIVENRAGSGGNIGADAVAKAAADGYTILVASGSILTVNPHLFKDTMPFDAKKDFTPITNIAAGPMLLIVRPGLPAANVKELIALAREKPKTITFGSAGPGSQVHMAGEAFAYSAGIEVIHVPYRGEAAAYNDLLGGQIDFIVGNIAAAASYVKSGKARALAVTSMKRATLLPDVPTLNESGMKGFENEGSFGFIAPAGTAKAIIDKISRDTAMVLEEPTIKERLFAQGMTAIGDSPDDYRKSIDAEYEKWRRIVQDRNISMGN
jgi:tripartite-type tricarboxylate transporter receptor subunit TctC